MIYVFQSRIHIWQSVLAILSVSLVSFLEVEISFLRHELIGTPFFLVVSAFVLMGDYLSGLVAIALSSVSLLFLNADGWHLYASSTGRCIEFLIISILVYYLSWRTKDLMHSRSSLEDTVTHLKRVSKRLKSQARVNKNDIEKLRLANSELQLIVNDIMEDPQLWAHSVKDVVTNHASIPKNKKKQTRRKSS